MTERDDLPGEVPAAADDAAGSVGAEESAAPTGKYGKLLSEEGGVRKLTGMYRNWFLDLRFVCHPGTSRSARAGRTQAGAAAYSACHESRR